MRIRLSAAGVLVCAALLMAACPKGGSDYSAGRKAEDLKDFDTALKHYEEALKAEPRNTEYKLKVARLRFEAGYAHVSRGQKLRDAGQLEEAQTEFQKALAIDPSSAVAYQELRRTMDLIAAKSAPALPAAPPAAAKPEEEKLMEAPPALRPLSREPINLKLTNDAKVIFETIGKLAGITVVFDPDFQGKRIATELTNVTLEQALDVVALQSKAFWQPATSNIIFISTDNVQKRRDYQEQVVKTIYLSNTLSPTDLTEIVTGLRQVLEVTRVQQVNALNAIVIRATPDKVFLAEKIVRDIDKAKPEVIISVAVLQARRDRARELGIQPGTSGTLTFTPGGTTTSGTGTTTSGATSLPLNQLQRLSSHDYSITLPGAAATALMTDSSTKIIQNPEIRTVDGQQAKLNIGDRVPIATGSFQAGVGVGVAGAGAGGGLVNPLVNTQFQYLDVGVNIDITPRIHANREVSLKVSIEVSSVTGRVDIGGIQQPIISQRKATHDIRLKEGEVNILGGIIEESETKSVSGWPGFSKIPFLRYLFSEEKVDKVESEVLILLTPKIVRLPEITAENLRGLASGTEANVQVRTEAESIAPVPSQPTQQPPAGAPVGAPPPTEKPAAQQTPAQPAQPPTPTPAEQAGSTQTKLRFEPPTLDLQSGQKVVIGMIIDDAKDLFSIPLMLQYDPKVISVEEVRQGGFLSGGTQEVAIVQRIDAQRGQAVISATRPQNAGGVNGTGTLVGIVIRAVGPGTSQLSIVQARPRDSRQQPIPVVSQEATIRVK